MFIRPTSGSWKNTVAWAPSEDGDIEVSEYQRWRGPTSSTSFGAVLHILKLGGSRRALGPRRLGGFLYFLPLVSPLPVACLCPKQ